MYNQILEKQDFGYKEEYRINTIKDIFRDKSKLISKYIKAYIYNVNYKYTTVRGNVKHSNKIVVLNESDIGAAKSEVIDYINNYNNKFPYRMMSNVKILDVFPEEIVIQL